MKRAGCLSDFECVLSEFRFVHLQFGHLKVGILLVACVIEEVHEVAPFKGAVDLLRETESLG